MYTDKGQTEQANSDYSRAIEINPQLKKEVEQEATGQGPTVGATARAGVSKEGCEIPDSYHVEIWDLIRKNFAFPADLVQSREARIVATIMKNGEIRDIRFEERSGSRRFDDSVLEAVRKSDPLPPLPEGYPGPFYNVGFNFNVSVKTECNTGPFSRIIKP